MNTITRPSIIKHIGKNYYNATELKKYDPVFFHGTSAGIRKIVAKKNIEKTNFHYSTLSKKSGWVVCKDQDKPPSKAKLLLLESWVTTNVPKMMPDSDESKDEKYEYPEAPELLFLEDDEKFKDDDGNIVDIETRGERTSKGIYFLAKDVSKAFEMPSLDTSLLHKDKGYEINIHYKVFTSSRLPNVVSSMSKKQLFITYRGMLKILFSSRTGNAEKFVDWATETLFTVQMGTEDQKEELGSKLIGQSVKSVRAVFKTCSKKVPCIYRFSLGTAKDLRKTMNLPDEIKDDFTIIKFGLTDSLDRRSSEHATEYGKIPNVNLGLMDFSYIDPKFLPDAEKDINDFFKNIEIPVNYKKYKELVAIDPKHEKQIKKQYEFIATAYQGSITELIDQIKELKYQIHLKDMEIESKNKEIESIKENKQLEIEIKDEKIKYEQLKNEMLEMKLSHRGM